jgi:3-hydroxyisobutyrate dehydrogenase
MQIGYVGLGAMGGALARRLLREHSLVVFDINHDAVAQFEKAGAAGVSSSAELAGKCSVIMMCLALVRRSSCDLRAGWAG